MAPITRKKSWPQRRECSSRVQQHSKLPFNKPGFQPYFRNENPIAPVLGGPLHLQLTCITERRMILLFFNILSNGGHEEAGRAMPPGRILITCPTPGCPAAGKPSIHLSSVVRKRKKRKLKCASTKYILLRLGADKRYANANANTNAPDLVS